MECEASSFIKKEKHGNEWIDGRDRTDGNDEDGLWVGVSASPVSETCMPHPVALLKNLFLVSLANLPWLPLRGRSDRARRGTDRPDKYHCCPSRESCQ